MENVKEIIIKKPIVTVLVYFAIMVTISVVLVY